jgi:hypothetical protein
MKLKDHYLSLMAKTLTAYTDDHIRDYFARVQAEGLTEHGFARLTSNLGILIAHGIRTDLRELFLEMMDFCCREIPRRKAANDFSVREIVCCIEEVERAGAVDADRIAHWKDLLRTIDPTVTYTVYAKAPTDPVRNWALFTAVSEYARLRAGLGGSMVFIETQIASQLQWIDENGMYKDHAGTEVHQPFVYDLVARGLFAILLFFGYRGRYFDVIDGILKKSALLTLRMQSVTGEIPFGGRSNQFVHNEAWLATVFTFERNRYRREGNTALADRFDKAISRALQVTGEWLSRDGIRHIKNRFPLDSLYGCEGYGYFDKYMITTASFLYTAYMLTEDGTELSAGDAEADAESFATSYHFHKVFLKNSGYALEFDTNADPYYDAKGLGRVHRAGAPSALCLSVPCLRAKGAKYRIDRADALPLSLCPAVCRNGIWEEGTADGVGHTLTALERSGRYATFRYTFSSGETVTADYAVSRDGVEITVKGDGAVGYMLPAFLFDGEAETVIACDGRVLTVEYGGWRCTYATDGAIEDTGRVACNRSGYYRAFRATKEGTLCVTVGIAPCE